MTMGQQRRVRRWQPSPALLQLFAWGYVASIGVIAIAGATVRLTGSGLGCSTWPDCQQGSLVPDAAVDTDMFHQVIEFVHRVVATTSLVTSLGLFVLVLLLRPRRRQLARLAAIGPIGVLIQAFLGAVVVLTELTWWMVALHLLLPLGLLFVGVIVALRLPESDEPVRYVVPRWLVRLIDVALLLVIVIAVLGTLATASGPHGGDADTPRLEVTMWYFVLPHQLAVYLFVALLLVVVAAAVRLRAPTTLLLRLGALIAVTASQATIGLTQWALGVPADLVIAHVGGAVAVVAVAAVVAMGTRTREPAPR